MDDSFSIVCLFLFGFSLLSGKIPGKIRVYIVKRNEGKGVVNPSFPFPDESMMEKSFLQIMLKVFREEI